MKLRIIALLALLIGTFGVLGLSSPSVVAQDGVLDKICNQTPDATVCKENDKTQTPTDNSIYGPNGLFTKAARIVAIIVGIVSLFVIIISGFQYVLSSGDSTKVNNAKNMILYAIIGLGVALLAQVLIVFVVSKL